MTVAEDQSWEIAHVGLCVNDVSKASDYYATIVGLTPSSVGGFSNGTQGLSLYRPDPNFAKERGLIHNPLTTKFAAIGVDDLDGVQKNLERHQIAYSDIDDAVPALGRSLFCYDPSMNLVAFTARTGVTPANADWILHHVNLQAHDVRETIAFFVDIAGMTEGKWIAPPDMGDFSIDPNELAVLTLGGDNRGLHIIRPDAGFGYRNGFAHNPSIGGHPAFRVPDIHAVMSRLDDAGTVYSDAGTYAMTGYHQVYVFDPAYNLIEINQRIV